MEEEKKEVVEEQPTEEQPAAEPKAKEYSFKVTAKLLNMLFALAALGIVVLVRLFLTFGVFNEVLHSILAVVVHALPILGATFSYLQAKKPTFEFYANVFAFVVVILGFPIW